ncbi:MAG: SLBB domain-containing protein [Halobacteriovoraceae bacterium]|nr:SLBB domain-containing protein [Halobacteriovoraceae bacterium]
MKKYLTLLLCYLFCTQASWAMNDRMSQYKIGTPSEFVFQSYKGQELMTIKLLGAVRKSGLYHVPKEMDLATLLSLAGGTTSDANLNSVLIGQKRNKTQKSLEVNVEEKLEQGNINIYDLRPDDVVLVKRKKPVIGTDTWRLISLISLALTSILTVVAIDDRLND